MARTERASNSGGGLVEVLPQAIFLEIMAKLDVESLCSLAPLCKSLHSSVSHCISSLSALDLSDFSPTISVLKGLLSNNEVLQILTLDCRQLDDSSVEVFAKGSLQELVLLRCSMFSSYIFRVIGKNCHKLRIFTVEVSLMNDCGSVLAYNEAIGKMLTSCLHLQSLNIKLYDPYPQSLDPWSIQLILPKTVNGLLLQPISNTQANELIHSIRVTGTDAYFADVGIGPMISCLQSLSLVLDKITDELLFNITSNLHQLVELCLEDNPPKETSPQNDLTNSGLQMLGTCRNLLHLSLTRRRRSPTTFKWVNDLGILVLAEECKRLESVRLGGFSKVTDAGYASILHSCKNLKRLQVVNALLSDLAFHDIANDPSFLVEARLISCDFITCETAKLLSLCKNLEVLDLSGCKSIADVGLNSISTLCRLTILNICSVDITDDGLSALGGGGSPIQTLCLRSCKRISDGGIVRMLNGDGVLSKTLVTLDLGYVRISDAAIFAVVDACKELWNLCIRNCFFVSDKSIFALGSSERSRGKRYLRKLDLYNCCSLTAASFQWLRSPFFCGLRWLGVGSTMLIGKDIFLELMTDKPGLTICSSGCEIGCKDGWQFHECI